jgi:hypothetical protein
LTPFDGTGGFLRLWFALAPVLRAAVLDHLRAAMALSLLCVISDPLRLSTFQLRNSIGE